MLVISSSGSSSHAPAPLVQRGDRLAQLGQAAAHRVAVVARVLRRLAQLVDGDLRRGDVGVAEAQVDHVRTCSPCVDLQTVDDREDVRGQVGDPAELHRRPRYSVGTCVRPFVATCRHAKRSRDDCIHVVIEIPRGSRNKYEIDHDTGRVFLDRRLFTATTYPADYGFIPDTLGGDGDPLDALVLLEDPVYPGRVGAGPPGRRAVHGRRGRRRRQDHLRAADRAALAGRRTTSPTSRRSWSARSSTSSRCTRRWSPARSRAPAASPGGTAAWAEIEASRTRFVHHGH